MVLKKNDFIEIEFTGRVKGGEVFDSNIKEDLKDKSKKTNPFIYSLGNKMFLEGIDKFLIGKDLGKYEIELSAVDAFGKRDPKLIQMIPKKIFVQHGLNPIPGVSFNFHGKIGRVLTVSGGRVIVDFNNPIAGKDVVYKIIVKRKVEDLNEKINALNEFFLRDKFPFEVKEGKIILKVPKGFSQFVILFKNKYKEILDLEVTAEEVEKKSEN